MAKNVRCKNCGRLAVRNGVDAQVLPASESNRATGLLRVQGGGEGLGPWVSTYPDTWICYVGESAFVDELQSGAGPLAVIDCNRDCDSHIDWTPGRSPEQHLTMRELQQQREHNAKMLVEERKWREEQAAADRAWKDSDREAREAEAARVERRHQENAGAASSRFWIGFLFAILVALTGQAASNWIQRTWPPQPPKVEAPVVNLPPINLHLPPAETPASTAIPPPAPAK